MKYNEKLYVGFQRERYSRSDDPRILGFAVPENTTKASATRKKTVDTWRQKDIDPRVIENKPMRGFKVVDFATRYSTSNKLFRVLDPRGFELEISADNLVELITNTTLVNGEIIDECLWMQHNGVHLVTSKDERYLAEAKLLKSGPVKIEPGKYYHTTSNGLSVFRFEGIYHHTYLNVKHVATQGVLKDDETQPRGYYGRRDQTLYVDEYETRVDILMNSGKRPSYVYTEFSLDEHGNVDRIETHVRKSHFKGLIEYDGDINDEMSSEVFDPMHWVDMDRNGYITSEDYKNITMTSYTGTNHGFFKTKEEAKAYNYLPIIHKMKPNETHYYYERLDISKFGADTNIRKWYPSAKQEFVIVDKR